MKLPNLFERETTPLTFQPGEVIFTAGEPAGAMYVIHQGEVELRVGDRIVDTMGPDEFFGEMALIEAGPRTATAVAVSECTLVPIDERKFGFLVHEVPFFALNMMRVICQRLRRTMESQAER